MFFFDKNVRCLFFGIMSLHHQYDYYFSFLEDRKYKKVKI